jgi:hypothetical protein
MPIICGQLSFKINLCFKSQIVFAPAEERQPVKMAVVEPGRKTTPLILMVKLF